MFRVAERQAVGFVWCDGAASAARSAAGVFASGSSALASLLTEAAAAERQALAEQVDQQAAKVLPLFENGDYASALSSLASLRAPVDNFFDEVMVMADDEAVRNNRLALLNRLRNLFLRVADISLLPTAG